MTNKLKSLYTLDEIKQMMIDKSFKLNDIEEGKIYFSDSTYNNSFSHFSIIKRGDKMFSTNYHYITSGAETKVLAGDYENKVLIGYTTMNEIMETFDNIKEYSHYTYDDIDLDTIESIMWN